MAGTVRINTTIRFTDSNGVEREPLTTDKSVSVDGTYVDLGINTLATSTAKTLIDVTDASFNISDFDVLAVVMEDGEDGKVLLELTTDVGGTERHNSIPLAKNVPLVLGADDSYNGTAGSFAGTLDVLQKVQAKNISSTTSARVRLIAVT